MPKRETRIEALYQSMSARDRAIAILQSEKAGEDEEELLMKTLPKEQRQLFYEYMALLVAVGGQKLGYRIRSLWQTARELDAHKTMLAVVSLWAVEMDRAGQYLRYGDREPIASSRYVLRVDEARAATIEIGVAAKLVASNGSGPDLEDAEVPARALRDEKKRLRGLIDDGTILAERRDRRTYIQAGSFYDYLGQAIPMSSDAGLEYEVLPDARAHEIDARVSDRTAVLEILEQAPKGLWTLLHGDRIPDADCGSPVDQAARHALNMIEELLPFCWRELRTVEMLVGEVRDDFRGEDPLLPDDRRALDNAIEILTKVRDFIADSGRELDLAEPDADDVEQLKRQIEFPRKKEADLILGLGRAVA